MRDESATSSAEDVRKEKSLAREIVITGGLGFIGSHVADAYLAAGDRVTVIDSEVAAVVDGSEYETHPRCKVIREPVEEVFKDDSCLKDADRVVHAASHVGPAGILQYSGRLGPEMVRAAECVIERCIQAGVPLCVFSSAEVYGRSGVLAEDDDIRVPIRTTPNRVRYSEDAHRIMMVNSPHRGLRAIRFDPSTWSGRVSLGGGARHAHLFQQALRRTDNRFRFR